VGAGDHQAARRDLGKPPPGFEHRRLAVGVVGVCPAELGLAKSSASSGRAAAGSAQLAGSSSPTQKAFSRAVRSPG